MITIEDWRGKIDYAENNDEFTNSLFVPSRVNGGTLALFHKISKRKNETIYWIDETSGYWQEKINGMWGQVGKLKDGSLWFQWTTATIWKDGVKQK